MEAPATAPTPPPQAMVVQMILGGWSAKVLSDVTRLDIPDIVHRHGPQNAANLVAKYGVGAHPGALERALRTCAAMGIFTEDAVGNFGLTPLSETLTLDSPVSVKRLVECFAHSSFYRVFAGLPEVLRTGAPQTRAQIGSEWWDYLNAHPDELELFGDAMKSNSISEMQAVLDQCDLAGAKKVVDVGGGLGHLVIALLEKYPRLQGVLLDLPSLIPVAKERLPVKDRSVASRLEYVGGSMFDSVPPADIYVMKHIIHDWDDEHCVHLLTNCRQSMQGDGRVIAVDAVLPPLGDTGAMPAKLTDIVMMAFIGGKERTREQWEALFSAAGLRITRVTPAADDNIGTSIVEGMKR